MMSDLPPPIPPSSYAPVFPYNDPRKTDRDHLRLLSIFSYVSAGLALLGIGFLVLHYNMMRMVLDNPQIWNNPPGMHYPPGTMRRVVAPPDFRPFFNAFRWFYIVFGLWGVTMAVLNVVAGYLLGQRRQRMFCLVVAVLNCLRIPLGTALGIFTLMVLTRDSVRALYAGENGGSASASDKLPS